MKGNVHFMVPKDRLSLLTGADVLSEYTFGTHTAKVIPQNLHLCLATHNDCLFSPALVLLPVWCHALLLATIQS
jgi:hypothetical protein